MNRFANDEREWLEPDGLGGFASGTVSGVRTRRYHGLLLVATTPPTGRMVLVNGFDAWVETAAGRFALSGQRYGTDADATDVVAPDGAARIEAFAREPWPTWIFQLEDGTRVQQEIVVPYGQPSAVMTWRVLAASGHTRATSGHAARLIVRPFLSGRDYHSLHHENAACRREASVADGLVVWQPYGDVPAVISRANARYEHQPDWYRRFLYTAERARGLDDTEDLFTPGVLTWDLSASEAVWCLQAGRAQPSVPSSDPRALVDALRADARARRARLGTPLARAADAYLVRRGHGRTIVAGYPWFTDWGRDTFIALRGLCLTTGRVEEARDILLEWSGTVSVGMLPNRFPDAGGEPEFNSVDASLWFIVAVRDLVAAADRGDATLSVDARQQLMAAVAAIVEGYAAGTRFGIRMDDDGLLACGVPGLQLTWMDARVGDWTVTPRVGKPVEVEALWLAALRVAARADARWADVYERGRAAFAARFWNADAGCLYDVVDVDHELGRVDATFRPNQILAVGGLGESLLDDERARLLVDEVERRLLTPLGLRSLAPGESGYTPHYEGPPASRDASYHRGTVWPWLMGPFVDAWLHVHGRTRERLVEARARFLAPLMAHLEEAGLGHVSEIADAEPPFTPRGCPFQAWSVGELIRIDAAVRAAGSAAGAAARADAREQALEARSLS